MNIKLMTSLIILSLSAQAAPVPRASHYLTGFYLKAGLGGTSGQFNVSQEFVQDIINTQTFIQSVDHSIQGTNFAGLLGMGYMHQMDALWVLGAEFTMGFTSVNGSYKNNSALLAIDSFNSKVETKLSNDFALLFKPGLAIQQKTLFYALLGPRWGNFETSLKTNTTIDGVFINSISSNITSYELGFTVGLGVERLFTEHWGMSLEYAYTTYGDIPSLSNTFTQSIAHDTATVDVTDNVTATAASNNVLLEVSYRF